MLCERMQHGATVFGSLTLLLRRVRLTYAMSRVWYDVREGRFLSMSSYNLHSHDNRNRRLTGFVADTIGFVSF